MATNNRPLGWTTIKESKALIKAGLNPNTADMYWPERMTYSITHPRCGIAFKKDLPCWSLGALWKLLPQYIEGYHLDANKNGLDKDIVSYISGDFFALQSYCSDYQIESVAKMALWCLSNGYIKK